MKDDEAREQLAFELANRERQIKGLVADNERLVAAAFEAGRLVGIEEADK